jgi:hypothetical protein
MKALPYCCEVYHHKFLLAKTVIGPENASPAVDSSVRVQVIEMSPAGHRCGMEDVLRTVHGRLSPTRGRSCRHEPVIAPRCFAAWCYNPSRQWQAVLPGVRPQPNNQGWGC